MSLTSGTRLGAYEITGQLGAGGMGEVYRARDTKLGRDVALKVVAESFTHDPERVARFHREAQLLAALNHPHIATIYGLEEAQGLHFLAMELVEGDTLAQRLKTGPIPVAEALAMARQVADALQAAHEKGIIHRDLKPANIALTVEGQVKVLDFGLAKMVDDAGRVPVTGHPGHAGSREQDPAYMATRSPTLSLAATQAGMILGTAAYMAPEQAKGRPADSRGDMWSFGCVLYEILTGKRAFAGEDASDTLAFVLAREPEWPAMPADVPLAVRTLLRTCLEKDRRRRTVDATTALFVLDNAASLVERVMEAPAGQPVVAPAVRVPFWRRAVPVTAAVLVSASVAGYAVWTLRSEPVRPPVRFVITLPEGEQFTAIGRHAVAISPSASHIVYSANGRLNLRALDQLEARPVAGTEGSLDPTQATAGRSPVFSPDGQWIGFWQNGQLKKVSVTGGAPVTLCAADNPWGASWGADDTILLGQGPMGIMRVAGAGGTPEVLIKVEAGQSAHGPQMLPGGRAVLFTLMEGSALWDEARVVVQTLETGERKELIKGGTDARYLATGHLVYALQDSVLAVPFDADALEVTGGPVPLVEHVARAPSGTTGSAHFSISADGTLVYIPDTAGAIGVGVQRTLAWVDRQGREEPLNAPVRVYRYPRISPDGQRVALDLLDEQHDIWIWHLTGETLTRLTLDPAVEEYGVWTPDGRRVIFSSTRAGGSSLFWQAADGTGAVERLTEGQNRQFPMAVSPDGTRLVFMEDSTSSGGNSGSDLMMLLLQGERRPQPLVQTPFSERNAEISPDGRWLAYDSNESGRYEVYVRPFPNVNDGRWQVSTGGGARPLWARNGQELFYMTSTSAGDTLMSAAVVGGPPFKAGTPMKVFDAPDSAYFAFAGRAYDVSPDGRRFLLIKTAAGAERAAAPASMTVVQGWFDELRRRVPVN